VAETQEVTGNKRKKINLLSAMQNSMVLNLVLSLRKPRQTISKQFTEREHKRRPLEIQFFLADSPRSGVITDS